MSDVTGDRDFTQPIATLAPVHPKCTKRHEKTSFCTLKTLRAALFRLKSTYLRAFPRQCFYPRLERGAKEGRLEQRVVGPTLPCRSGGSANNRLAMLTQGNHQTDSLRFASEDGKVQCLEQSGNTNVSILAPRERIHQRLGRVGSVGTGLLNPKTRFQLRP
jgi:hypothetical protein